jgi:peroxiredoxin
VFALVTILATPAVAQPEIRELLRSLNLAGYSHGEQSPGFSGRTAAGGSLSLADLRGRVVLLTFWATWCAPCREEMSLLEQLYRGLKSEGVTVVGVNVREEGSAVLAYGNALGLTFPLLLDRRGDVQAAYGVIGLPTAFLIARDGRPVARAVGPRDWGVPESRTLVKALLEEPIGGR